MDYSKTLHLPQTDFPMRGNLPQKEPGYVKLWQDMDLYHKRLAKRDGAPKSTERRNSCSTTARLTRTARSTSATP